VRTLKKGTKIIIHRPAAEISGDHHTYANNPFENITLINSNPRIYLSRQPHLKQPGRKGDTYQNVAKSTAVEVCLIQTIAKNDNDNSAIECNQNVKNTTPKSQFRKNSKPNALPSAAKIIPTSPEIILNVIYQLAYQLSRRRPINIIHLRRCFSFSLTRAFIAIRTAGSAVTMKKKQGPREEERVSGTRVRGRVGKGRRVRLKDVGWLVELRIASERVRSK